MELLDQNLVALVRADIDKEALAGWPRLRRVPSTYTWSCLDYLASLSASRQGLLFDAIAERAPALLGLSPLPTRWTNPALVTFSEEVLRQPSQHVSARLLRGMLASMRNDGPQGLFSGMSEAMITTAEAIKPTSAPQIRKAVKQEFGQHFGATVQNQGAGNWRYTGQSSERAFSVLIDYGGQVDQLRYFVELSDPSTGLHTKTLSYEGLLGLGFGRWDFVTADGLLENVQLLRELIEELVRIPDRLSSQAST